MKRENMLKYILVLFFSSWSTIYTQTELDTSANSIRNKYAVPDAPAFNILDEVSGNILQPTSVKQIAVNLSDFLGENEKITLPEAFAVEVSPGLLIGGKNLTLKKYRENRGLYRLRLSLATKRDSSTGSASSLALGLRGTLIDNSDLRTNPEYIRDATILAERIVDSLDAMGPNASKEEIEEKRKEIEEEFTNKWDLDKWSENQWNASIVEWAIAFKADSKDSLAENLKFNKVAAWFSGALRAGSWGQWILGLNAFYEKVSDLNKYKSNLSLASRLYIGMNTLKVFIHLQGVAQESREPVWVINSGLEVKVTEGIWADFNGGVQYGEDADNGKFITDFKLKYGI